MFPNQRVSGVSRVAVGGNVAIPKSPRIPVEPCVLVGVPWDRRLSCRGVKRLPSGYWVRTGYRRYRGDKAKYTNLFPLSPLGWRAREISTIRKKEKVGVGSCMPRLLVSFLVIFLAELRSPPVVVEPDIVLGPRGGVLLLGCGTRPK